MEIVTNSEILRKTTSFVKDGDDINQCVDELLREMKEHNAIGLSANQLGYNYRIFVMNIDVGPPICIVNPMITKPRGSNIAEEGCLSIPEVKVGIKRPQQIVLKGVNRYFKPVRYRLSGLQARVACHEVDHLFGKLITDYEEE